ncbi:MAG: hypothetical protein COZ59_06885 [Bacteroidetes bacterium CG_4_8_14_3_um_filter_31_14]|nr:MAG: hypothetical protein COZ59_06885 [Bacteroidetes bacterium CG_4_8_14_3_um_filter_31_14]
MENLKYSEILAQNQILRNTVKGIPYRISVLSNVTINSLKEILEYSLRVNQINPSIELGNYDNIIQDSVRYKDSDLVVVFFDMLNVVDSVSTFFEDINDELYNNLKNRICAEIDIIIENLKDSPSVIFNSFSSNYFIPNYTQKTIVETLVIELNKYLEERKNINISIINIDKIFTKIGIKQAIDFRLYNSSKAPYTLSFLKNYVTAINPIIYKNTGKLKKAIIFDCDNTLWKGIIGEDGIEKIDMSISSHFGKFYNKIQQIAVFLSKRGVIIGICSKNNESDVTEVLLNHPDVILKDEYIAIKKINWEDKTSNLLLIASELNIGLDSIVFVDDSSFEINLIKEQIPEIVSIQVPSAIYEYPDFLLQYITNYFNLSLNSEDAKKTIIYKQQTERESDKKNHKSIDEYLASLNISLTISVDDLSQIPRIAQLTQKTNQFNITTKRYTENQILNMINSVHDNVFAVSVADKFGDNGITAVCIIKTDLQNKKKCNIDTFLMSCRIIGRNIEFVLMDYIIGWLISHNFTTVTAKFIPTKKNQQVQDFYSLNGFALIKKESDYKIFSIELSKYQPKNISYISINFKELK